MKNLFKYLAVILLLLAATESFAQWRLVMEIVVTDEGKKLAGSEIKVFRNGSLVETVTSDARGRADIPMDPDGEYTIEIGGNKGFIKKKIAVSTKNVPPEAAKGDIFYPAEVELFSKIDGLNLSILEKPIGKVEYDEEYGEFGADRKYTKEVQSALADLKDSYLEQKEKEEEKLKEKQKEYDDAIKVADKAYANEKWEEAAAAYEKAQSILPIETYPSFQLAELETKLIKIRETNKKYDEAIAKADAAYASKDYETAIAEFKRASGYKPNESYPQDKISEVQGLLANQAKAEQTYLAAIERGDNALKVNDLESAKVAFTEATTAKPSESYPKNKLAEINDIQNKENAKEEEYQAAITAGDEALKASKFEEAKAAYQKASGSKPIESYPKEQLAKIDGLIAAAVKKEQNYIAAIEMADNALASKKYKEAKTAYNEASGVKPNEEYPKNKIKEIDALLAKKEDTNKAYEDKISIADKALDNKEYESAKTAYSAASGLKPSEAYPAGKIKEIDGILAQKAKVEADYAASIAKADQALKEKKFQEAKTAYNAAIALKPDEQYPKDQLNSIETIVLKNQAAEEEYKTAIANGDEALGAKDYEKSKEFYNQAIALKAEESYPKDKIAEIEKTIAAAAEIEKTYQLAIKEGDAAFKEKEFEKAKTAFTNAASIKPKEAYPKDQLTAIDEKIAAAQQLESDYKAAIASGDDATEAKDYAAAKGFYEKALDIKSSESYPKTKITELESLIAANAKKEEEYNAAIASGDQAFESKNWKEAKSNYQIALGIKEDAYPKNKIASIETKLKAIAEKEAVAAKVEADYQAAVSEGDKAVNEKNYDAALTAFTRASELKAEENYPLEKITAIKQEQAKLAKAQAEKERLAALEKEYSGLIEKADNAMKANKLESARKDYQAALALKSEEAYPKEKIEEINGQLADEAQQDELYATAISSADALLAEKKLEEAKGKYGEALSIKSAEKYPKDKIGEIDKELAAITAEQEEIRLKQEKSAEKDAQFTSIVDEADQLLAAKNYNEAKGKYEAALAVKKDGYPVKKIEEIRAILLAKAGEAEAEAAAAEQAKIDAKYQGFVAEADALLKVRKYQEAKSKYEAALGVKEAQYPRDQLSSIDEQIAALAAKEANAAVAKQDAKKEAEYVVLITDADALFEQQRYKMAQAKYEDAIALKEDSYPASQLAEIERLLNELEARDVKAAEQAKIDEKYKLVTQRAEEALTNDQFEDALNLFKEARSLKPNETYPPNKIDQLIDILNNSEQSRAAQRAIIESKYMESITLADIAMIEEDYVDAKEYFKNAKRLKPNETYPQKKLDEINSILAQEDEGEEIKLQREREAKNEEAYQTAIATADKFFVAKKYNESENEYGLALGLKPSEEYPKAQVERIKKIREELAAAKILAEKDKDNAADQEAKYKQYIASGDEAFKSESYRSAKSNYQNALGIKPNEAYPRDKINAIDQLLDEEQNALAENREQEEKPIVIQKGPKSTVTGDAEAEIEKRYQEMLAKKNSDKNQTIEEKEKAVKKVSDANREAELKKRENAIERIENISVTLREQESLAKDLNMQNYEKVKQKTADLSEEEQSLKRDSERKRNGEFVDAVQQETAIRTYQKGRSEALVESRTEKLKQKTEDLTEEEQSLKSDAELKRNIEFANAEQKETAIRTYQKERSEDLMEGRKDNVEEDYANLMATNKQLAKEQSRRTEKAEQDYVMKEDEIRLYNSKLATENLNANTNQINKVEEDWKTTNQTYRKDSKERITTEQQKINDKQIGLRQFSQDGGDSFKDNQISVEEKEKILKEEQQKLTSDSEQRRQGNADIEYYDGEDRPRQDAEAADLPQGVSQEIIENPNNSTTIRRTVVNETEVDVYEKTFFPWGGVFYTKNGNNITQDSWDNNSR